MYESVAPTCYKLEFDNVQKFSFPQLYDTPPAFSRHIPTVV